MPRPKMHTRMSIVSAAMHHFWQNGYEASSIDDVVKATGVSRHSLYSEVGGKFNLYSDSFTAYQTEIVTPALEAVEQPNANLASIACYFETQISLAEQMGLPGPGCFVANAMTETAPHHAEIRDIVAQHNNRLNNAFINALSNSAIAQNDEFVSDFSTFLVTTAQGLWSLSRVVDTATPLRNHVKTLMSLLDVKVNAHE